MATFSSATAKQLQKSNYETDSRRVKQKHVAFTLAEVLITLGIIGVVAALTLPMLVQNDKKQVVVTRLQKFYSVMDQAIRQSEVENGDKKYWINMGTNSEVNGEIVVPDGELAPLDWYKKYLAKYVITLKVDKGDNTFSKDLGASLFS